MFSRALTLLGRTGLQSARLGSRSTGAKSSRTQTRSSSSSGSGPSSGHNARTGSVLGGVIEAGVASGGLSLLGDLLAQAYASEHGFDLKRLDWHRAVRMASFGLLLYGPYQYWWYGALAKQFPLRNLAHAAAKITANQLVLGPLCVGGIFAWNLALQGQAHLWPTKMSADFQTTLVNGWKFWVPAASVNFAVVPLQYQIWYMSACGLLWVAYLSYSSTRRVKTA